MDQTCLASIHLQMPNMTKMWGSGDPFRFLIHAQLFFEHQVSNDWTRAIRRDDSTPHRGFSLKRCRVKVVIACHSSSAKGLLGAFTKLVDSGKDHTFAANLVLMWVWMVWVNPQIGLFIDTGTYCSKWLLFVVSLLVPTFPLACYIHYFVGQKWFQTADP